MITPRTSLPHVVTLGTAGGPRWWSDGDTEYRSGIATAVIVGDRWYLVDCGEGAGRQAARAGLRLDRLGAVLVTHLHSDHVVDLAGLALFSLFARTEPGRVPLLGPGDRGRLTPLSPRTTHEPAVVAPHDPTPGIAGLFTTLCAAFATDVNDRVRDSLTRRPDEIFDVRDIALPRGCGFDPDDAVAPPMVPFEVFGDDRVCVTATLVSHHPTAPAFAFRFDTDDGSVTISGDTAPCDNLVRLASGTDLLLHEAIDLDSVGARYGDPARREATMDHHRRAHSTARQAGEMATRAGARVLALHHLVPGNAEPSVWWRATETFDGEVLVPDDLDVLGFGSGRAVIAAREVSA